jgi:hypothetical protein
MPDSVEAFYNKQKFVEARTLAQAQIQRVEKSFGRVDTAVELGLYYLTLVCYYNGKYSEGIPFPTEAIEICLTTMGKEHHDYGERLSILAALYFYMGQNDKVQPLYIES